MRIPPGDGRYSRTAQSIDELIAAYVVDKGVGIKEKSTTRSSHGIDMLTDEINAGRGFEIDKAVESGDYDKWKALMTRAWDEELLAKAAFHFLSPSFHKKIKLVSSIKSTMEKQKKFGLSAWAVLAVLFLAGAVTAYMADAPGNVTRGGRGYMGLWGGLQGSQNLSDLNLPENATRAQIREAVKEKTLTQLGLPSNATDAEIRDAMQKKANETQTQIDAAISSGDYAAWKALVEQTPRGAQLSSIITQDKFQKYQELYQAEKNVRSLSQELGLGGGLKMGGGCGFGGGRMHGKTANPPATQASQ